MDPSRPAIGGGFANPAERWPDVFGSGGFFSRYPYFLPCVVAALVPLFAFILASIALKEVRRYLHDTVQMPHD
jgi:hypothetical protein